MIEKEIERKIVFIHAVYGLLAGLTLGVYYRGGVMPFLGAVIWALAISYPMMLITRSMYSLDREEFNFKVWLGKGFVYFFLTWMVAWIFAYNLT